MKTIGITGGTGLVGKHVAKLLVSKGYEVVLLSRNPAGKTAPGGCSLALFDAERQCCDNTALKTLDAVIHLAGEPVAEKRWTTAQKDKILKSRVVGTRFLTDQLKLHGEKCKTLIAASAIGYYGQDATPIVPFTEERASSDDFLGRTAAAWETATHEADSFLRTVILRIGIVLAKEGGAFPEFIRSLPLRVIPVLGSGRQMISWIHITDLAALFVYALERQSMTGTYNAVTPSPVTNKDLMRQIASVHGGFHLQVPVPAIALKVVLGEMSVEVLKSCTASASKTLSAGFIYQYPDIDGAVRNLLS